MKKIPVKLLSGILATSVVTASICAIGADISKSLKSNDKDTLNYIEKDVVSLKNAKALTEAQNEAKLTQNKVDVINKAVDEAQKEVESAEEKVEATKALEEEVEATKALEEEAGAKVESTRKEVEKTTANQKAAEEELTKADDLLKNAKKAQEAAEAEVKSAKTAEAKKVAEEKVKAAKEEVANATQVQKEANTKKQAAEEEAKQAEENIRNTQQSNNAITSNESKANESSTEQKSGGFLTDEILKKAAEGEKRDRENYEKALKEKGLTPPSNEHTVEFHFYSTLRDLKVRRNGDADYWATCGEDGVNCIWFAEFTCDMNECEGFAEPGSNELSGHVLLGRRGDTKEYIMQPPKAKPGYRFKAWEIVSAHGTVTQYGETGVLVSSYRAVYEKY